MRAVAAALLLLGAAVASLIGAAPAEALFDQPGPFFAPLTAQTPPPSIPLAIDGSPQSVLGTTSPTLSVTVSTSYPNEILLLAVSSLFGVVSGISDTAGLVWTKRVAASPATVGGVEEWYVYAPAVVTADVVTVTVSQRILNTVIVAAIVGTSIGTPFDLNASLPATNLGVGTSAATTSTFVSTSHANAMLIEIYNAAAPIPLPPAGFTDLGSGGNVGFAYRIVSAAQSGLTVTTGSNYDNAVITDAMQGN